MIYDNIVRNQNNILTIKNSVTVHFVGGAFVEIKGNDAADFTVTFTDKIRGDVVYSSVIRNNMWSRCNRKYFTDYKIEIHKNGELYYEHDYNCMGKRVYISIDSKALGDTLAWFPVIYEFKKKHQCDLVVSTFHNDLLQDQYLDVDFVSPGAVVGGLYAMYNIGLYYGEDGKWDGSKHPNNFLDLPMQTMVCEMLGLDGINEYKPKLKDIDVDIDPKLVTIAIHGTAQAKYWNNADGWQDVVDWLNGQGYTVKLLSRENHGYMGNWHPKRVIKHPSGTLDDVMREMKRSVMFIGVGSGLSWLSWALGVKTVLISGFSYNWAEMRECIRIGAAKGACSGCFNRHRLDQGDWNWCPDHKDTYRQFECSKSITGEHVIDVISKHLN